MKINRSGQENTLNQVPSADRVHISFFGRTNAGKSSLMNAITGQEVALVSEIRGTTTDPLGKTMEILPLGPVVLTDTPGLDDDSRIGEARVKRTMQILEKTDIAILVVDITLISAGTEKGFSKYEREMLNLFQSADIPYFIVLNKCESIAENKRKEIEEDLAAGEGLERQKIFFVSAKTGENLTEFKDALGHIEFSERETDVIIRDKLQAGDIAVLVVPIDASAPKGRLILPQQQTIRDILEKGAMAYVTQDTQLPELLSTLAKPPKVVITDSQVFHKIKELVPQYIYLTSFSILFARKKGNLMLFAENAKKLAILPAGSKILISEACTHHRQCGDIGTMKLPAWIRAFTGKEFDFSFSSGGTFPEDLSAYDLIVHCGGCMISRREMQARIRRAEEYRVPITNYGTLIAYMQGILERSMEIFKDEAAVWSGDNER